MNRSRKFPPPKPVKVEVDIDEVQNLATERTTLPQLEAWNDGVVASLAECTSSRDAKTFLGVLKKYAKFLEKGDTKCWDKIAFIKAIQRHVMAMYDYFSAHAENVKHEFNYVFFITKIIGLYCSLELDVHRDTLNRKYDFVTSVTNRLLALMFVSLNFASERVSDVLLRIQYSRTNQFHSAVMTRLYHHCLLAIPLETSHYPAFYSYYLNFEDMQALTPRHLRSEQMKYLLHSFGKSEEEMKDDLVLKKILENPAKSTVKTVENIAFPRKRTTRTYFKYLKSTQTCHVPSDRNISDMMESVGITSETDTSITHNFEEAFNFTDDLVSSSESESEVEDIVCEIDIDSDVEEVTYLKKQPRKKKERHKKKQKDRNNLKKPIATNEVIEVKDSSDDDDDVVVVPIVSASIFGSDNNVPSSFDHIEFAALTSSDFSGPEFHHGIVTPPREKCSLFEDNDNHGIGTSLPEDEEHGIFESYNEKIGFEKDQEPIFEAPSSEVLKEPEVVPNNKELEIESESASDDTIPRKMSVIDESEKEGEQVNVEKPVVVECAVMETNDDLGVENVTKETENISLDDNSSGLTETQVLDDVTNHSNDNIDNNLMLSSEKEKNDEEFNENESDYLESCDDMISLEKANEIVCSKSDTLVENESISEKESPINDVEKSITPTEMDQISYNQEDLDNVSFTSLRITEGDIPNSCYLSQEATNNDLIEVTENTVTEEVVMETEKPCAKDEKKNTDKPKVLYTSSVDDFDQFEAKINQSKQMEQFAESCSEIDAFLSGPIDSSQVNGQYYNEVEIPLGDLFALVNSDMKRVIAPVELPIPTVKPKKSKKDANNGEKKEKRVTFEEEKRAESPDPSPKFERFNQSDTGEFRQVLNYFRTTSDSDCFPQFEDLSALRAPIPEPGLSGLSGRVVTFDDRVQTKLISPRPTQTRERPRFALRDGVKCFGVSRTDPKVFGGATVPVVPLTALELRRWNVKVPVHNTRSTCLLEKCEFPKEGTAREQPEAVSRNSGRAESCCDRTLGNSRSAVPSEFPIRRKSLNRDCLGSRVGDWLESEGATPSLNEFVEDVKKAANPITVKINEIPSKTGLDNKNATKSTAVDTRVEVVSMDVGGTPSLNEIIDDDVKKSASSTVNINKIPSKTGLDNENCTKTATSVDMHVKFASMDVGKTTPSSNEIIEDVKKAANPTINLNEIPSKISSDNTYATRTTSVDAHVEFASMDVGETTPSSNEIIEDVKKAANPTVNLNEIPSNIGLYNENSTKTTSVDTHVKFAPMDVGETTPSSNEIIEDVKKATNPTVKINEIPSKTGLDNKSSTKRTSVDTHVEFVSMDVGEPTPSSNEIIEDVKKAANPTLKINEIPSKSSLDNTNSIKTTSVDTHVEFATMDVGGTTPSLNEIIEGVKKTASPTIDINEIPAKTTLNNEKLSITTSLEMCTKLTSKDVGTTPSVNEFIEDVRQSATPTLNINEIPPKSAFMDTLHNENSTKTTSVDMSTEFISRDVGATPSVNEFIEDVREAATPTLNINEIPKNSTYMDTLDNENVTKTTSVDMRTEFTSRIVGATPSTNEFIEDVREVVRPTFNINEIPPKRTFMDTLHNENFAKTPSVHMRTEFTSRNVDATPSVNEFIEDVREVASPTLNINEMPQKSTYMDTLDNENVGKTTPVDMRSEFTSRDVGATPSVNEFIEHVTETVSPIININEIPPKTTLIHRTETSDDGNFIKTTSVDMRDETPTDRVADVETIKTLNNENSTLCTNTDTDILNMKVSPIKTQLTEVMDTVTIETANANKNQVSMKELSVNRSLEHISEPHEDKSDLTTKEVSIEAPYIKENKSSTEENNSEIVNVLEANELTIETPFTEVTTEQTDQNCVEKHFTEVNDNDMSVRDSIVSNDCAQFMATTVFDRVIEQNAKPELTTLANTNHEELKQKEITAVKPEVTIEPMAIKDIQSSEQENNQCIVSSQLEDNNIPNKEGSKDTPLDATENTQEETKSIFKVIHDLAMSLTSEEIDRNMKLQTLTKLLSTIVSPEQEPTRNEINTDKKLDNSLQAIAIQTDTNPTVEYEATISGVSAQTSEMEMETDRPIEDNRQDPETSSIEDQSKIANIVGDKLILDMSKFNNTEFDVQAIKDAINKKNSKFNEEAVVKVLVEIASAKNLLAAEPLQENLMECLAGRQTDEMSIITRQTNVEIPIVEPKIQIDNLYEPPVERVEEPIEIPIEKSNKANTPLEIDKSIHISDIDTPKKLLEANKLKKAPPEQHKLKKLSQIDKSKKPVEVEKPRRKVDTTDKSNKSMDVKKSIQQQLEVEKSNRSLEVNKLKKLSEVDKHKKQQDTEKLKKMPQIEKSKKPSEIEKPKKPHEFEVVMKSLELMANNNVANEKNKDKSTTGTDYKKAEEVPKPDEKVIKKSLIQDTYLSKLFNNEYDFKDDTTKPKTKPFNSLSKSTAQKAEYKHKSLKGGDKHKKFHSKPKEVIKPIDKPLYNINKLHENLTKKMQSLKPQKSAPETCFKTPNLKSLFGDSDDELELTVPSKSHMKSKPEVYEKYRCSIKGYDEKATQECKKRGCNLDTKTHEKHFDLNSLKLHFEKIPSGKEPEQKSRTNHADQARESRAKKINLHKRRHSESHSKEDDKHVHYPYDDEELIHEQPKCVDYSTLNKDTVTQSIDKTEVGKAKIKHQKYKNKHLRKATKPDRSHHKHLKKPESLATLSRNTLKSHKEKSKRQDYEETSVSPYNFNVENSFVPVPPFRSDQLFDFKKQVQERRKSLEQKNGTPKEIYDTSDTETADESVASVATCISVTKQQCLIQVYNKNRNKGGDAMEQKQRRKSTYANRKRRKTNEDPLYRGQCTSTQLSGNVPYGTRQQWDLRDYTFNEVIDIGRKGVLGPIESLPSTSTASIGNLSDQDNNSNHTSHTESNHFDGSSEKYSNDTPLEVLENSNTGVFESSLKQIDTEQNELIDNNTSVLESDYVEQPSEQEAPILGIEEATPTTYVQSAIDNNQKHTEEEERMCSDYDYDGDSSRDLVICSDEESRVSDVETNNISNVPTISSCDEQANMITTEPEEVVQHSEIVHNVPEPSYPILPNRIPPALEVTQNIISSMEPEVDRSNSQQQVDNVKENDLTEIAEIADAATKRRKIAQLLKKFPKILPCATKLLEGKTLVNELHKEIHDLKRKYEDEEFDFGYWSLLRLPPKKRRRISLAVENSHIVIHHDSSQSSGTAEPSEEDITRMERCLDHLNLNKNRLKPIISESSMTKESPTSHAPNNNIPHNISNLAISSPYIPPPTPMVVPRENDMQKFPELGFTVTPYTHHHHHHHHVPLNYNTIRQHSPTIVGHSTALAYDSDAVLNYGLQRNSGQLPSYNQIFGKHGGIPRFVPPFPPLPMALALQSHGNGFIEQEPIKALEDGSYKFGFREGDPTLRAEVNSLLRGEEHSRYILAVLTGNVNNVPCPFDFEGAESMKVADFELVCNYVLSVVTHEFFENWYNRTAGHQPKKNNTLSENGSYTAVKGLNCASAAIYRKLLVKCIRRLRPVFKTPAERKQMPLEDAVERNSPFPLEPPPPYTPTPTAPPTHQNIVVKFINPFVHPAQPTYSVPEIHVKVGTGSMEEEESIGAAPGHANCATFRFT